MAKKIKTSKTSKKEEAYLPREVVFLDDVCEVLMKKFFHSMDVLRDVSFCGEPHKKKNK